MSEDNGKRILSISEMLAAEDVEFATIPAWKVKDPKTNQMVQGYVRIGSLSAERVAEWRESNEGEGKKMLGVRLFVDSLVDEAGNRIGNASHYEAFKKKSNAVQERVVAEVLKLNGMTPKAQEKVKND